MDVVNSKKETESEMKEGGDKEEFIKSVRFAELDSAPSSKSNSSSSEGNQDDLSTSIRAEAIPEAVDLAVEKNEGSVEKDRDSADPPIETPNPTKETEVSMQPEPQPPQTKDEDNIQKPEAEHQEPKENIESQATPNVESDSEFSSGERANESPKAVRFSEEVTKISAEQIISPSNEIMDGPSEASNDALGKVVRFAEEESEILPSSLDSEDLGDEKLPSLEDSEYETPEPEEDEMEKDVDDDDESAASDSGESESGGSQVLTEREEGDGQESEKKEKKLDHDEDKRDPQYIPKKGNFYEHDDRTSETEEAPTKKPIQQKAYDSKERWNHDLYDDDLQSPKSKQELIDQYGYDIRQEEGPPKARRRRRYGRGPNKYTRSWEEVEAYSKSRGSWRGRGRGRATPTPRNNEEEFPPLPQKKSAQDRIQRKKTDDNTETKDEAPPPLTPPPTKKKDTPPSKDEKKETPQPSSTPKKTFKQVYVEEQVIVASRGRGRGRGRVPFKQHHIPSHNTQSNQHHSKHSTAEEDIATLSQHFSQAVINVDNKKIMPITTQQQQTRASSLPPTSTNQSNQPTPSQSHDRPSQQPQQDSESALTEKSESKSKRYSTQRQRSLPQGAPPQPPQVAQQQPQPPQVAQQPQPPHFIQDQFFHQGGIEASPNRPPPFRQPPPAQFGPPPEVPMMAFIPPGGQFQPLYVPPPPYLPPPPIPVPAAAPRAEVYQGASGITYYNTQTQAHRPLSTSRRVKLAIPIVAPPDSS